MGISCSRYVHARQLLWSALLGILGVVLGAQVATIVRGQGSMRPRRPPWPGRRWISAEATGC
jgi:hypothetical protein